MQQQLSILSFFAFVDDQEGAVARCTTRKFDDDYEEEGKTVIVGLMLFASRLGAL